MTAWLKERFLLEGLMPERALLRLRRADIPLFHVKKTEKNRILFSVKKKDVEKVFAIYPNMCYNKPDNGAYRVKSLGATGLGKYAEKAKRRVGFLLGGLLGLSLVLASEPLVFTVDFVGTDVYAREVYQAFDEAGVSLFGVYRKGKEDIICAKMLALEGVEYCSVQKIGHRVAVDMRLSPFPSTRTETGVMQAKHEGEIVAMTVLRGSPLKKIGDRVRLGETLVGNWFSTEEGGQVRVEIIARVCIACTYEAIVEAEDEESAFAKAYLALGFSPDDKTTGTKIEKNGETYRVKIEYQTVETLNF